MQPIDEATFKLAMSQFASGVTVVTTTHEGAHYGMTVASFASLSLHPPLVVVCIESNAKTHGAIAAAGKFGVSILSSAQADISGRFASRVEDRFQGVSIRESEVGVPLIEGAICQLECRVHSSLPGGDHTIFVGEVLHANTTENAPLLYFRSRYHELA